MLEKYYFSDISFESLSCFPNCFQSFFCSYMVFFQSFSSTVFLTPLVFIHSVFSESFGRAFYSWVIWNFVVFVFSAEETGEMDMGGFGRGCDEKRACTDSARFFSRPIL